MPKKLGKDLPYSYIRYRFRVGRESDRGSWIDLAVYDQSKRVTTFLEERRDELAPGGLMVKIEARDNQSDEMMYSRVIMALAWLDEAVSESSKESFEAMYFRLLKKNISVAQARYRNAESQRGEADVQATA